MKKTFLIAIVFFLSISITYAEFNISNWKYFKSMSVPTDLNSTYSKKIIDNDIYSHSNLQDLRIIDSIKAEIPYKIVEEKDINYQKNIYADVFDSSVSGNQSMAIFDTKIDSNKANSLHSSITLSLIGKNYKRKVSIFASDKKIAHGDAGWRLINSNGYIFNFYDSVTGFNSGNKTINYSKTTARYIRVLISDGEGELPQINGANVAENLTNTAKIESDEYPLIIKNNLLNKTTELTVDLKADRIPASKIILSTSDKNWNRHAVLETSNTENGPWTMIAEDYLYSINQTLYTGTKTFIDFNESKSRFLRIVVSNYDNAPVNFDSKIAVLRNQKSIVYKATDYPSKLYYGNDKAISPQYDIEKLLSYTDQNEMISTKLGPEEINADYIAPKAPEKTFTEKYPQALNIILVIMVLLLAGFMFMTVRGAKSK